MKPAKNYINLYCCMYPECDSEYTSKFNLKRHVESVHLHIKKYKCTICACLFSSKQSLIEHQHIHSGLMPFKCSACHKYFRQASQLSLHRRIHFLEGVDSSYMKLHIKENVEIKPIELNYEADMKAYVLPKILDQKPVSTLLPYPKF